MGVIPGIERLLGEERERLEGRRVGLLANASSVLRDLSSTADRLAATPGVTLAALFSPEHGLDAAAAEGVAVGDSRYGRIPVYSLYGRHRRPTATMVDGIDLLIFDMQTVGARFYTYLTTLRYLMETAAAHNLPLIVCDRPNPVGGEVVEGPVLAEELQSFVGCAPLPIRHGLTVGEVARFFNEVEAIGCDLTVIPCDGWQRGQRFEETGLIWVPPSPNLPNLEGVALYPGTCLLEGTNLSEGRGTPLPFQIVGAPWLDGRRLAARLNELALPGIRFRPTQFTPSAGEWQGACCAGIQLHVTDPEALRPVTAVLHLLAAVRQQHADDFRWELPHFDRLVGTVQVRDELMAGTAVSDIVAAWEPGIASYMAERRRILLYSKERTGRGER